MYQYRLLCPISGKEFLRNLNRVRNFNRLLKLLYVSLSPVLRFIAQSEETEEKQSMCFAQLS